MTYVTQSAENLIDTLMIRHATFEDLAKREQQPVKKLAYTTWAEATAMAIEDVRRALPEIEAEARLIPETEPDIMAFADALVRDHFGTAA